MNPPISVTGAFRKVVSIVDSYAHLGQRTAVDGARLAGHCPAVAPKAYPHMLFPGLSRGALESLEEYLERAVPTDCREWLGMSNGMHMFIDGLSLFGFVLSNPRDADNPLPFSLASPNVT